MENVDETQTFYNRQPVSNDRRCERSGTRLVYRQEVVRMRVVVILSEELKSSIVIHTRHSLVVLISLNFLREWLSFL